MKLYHGTSSSRFARILKQGRLTPRGRRKGNWSHSVPSHPKAIYLTDAYPAYFAYQQSARQKHQQGVILELDAALLDEQYLIPDEDVLEQIGRGRDDVPGGMVERTLAYRNQAFLAFEGTPAWRESLEAMGTVAYYGPEGIPLRAITRVAWLDWDRMDMGILMRCMDTSVSVLNYAVLKERHRATTQWLFGETVDFWAFAGLPQILVDRDPALRETSVALKVLMMERKGIRVEAFHAPAD